MSQWRSPRKHRWHNVLSTLPKYERLLSGVQGLDEPVPTSDLQEYAGLASDLNGALGALFMLEAEGQVYPVRGHRRQYVWHPGERTDERPEKLPNLLPYQRVPTLLKHFGRTTVGTRPIMLDVHFVPVGEEAHGRHERLLGALKILVSLGVAAYDEEEAGWYHASASGRPRPYKARMFGERAGEEILVPFNEDEHGGD
jgi:hypothetical protein